MADNYLERKMEEHRAGRSSSPSNRYSTTPRGSRPGEWLVRFSPCQVFVDDIEQALNLQIARELIAIGFKVCFRHPDLHRGHKLATTLGARLLPPGLDPDEDAVTLRLSSSDHSLLLSRFNEATSVPLPISDNSLPQKIVNQIIFATINLATK